MLLLLLSWQQSQAGFTDTSSKLQTIESIDSFLREQLPQSDGTWLP